MIRDDTTHNFTQHANKASWYTTHVVQCIQIHMHDAQCTCGAQYKHRAQKVHNTSQWCNIYNIFNGKLNNIQCTQNSLIAHRHDYDEREYTRWNGGKGEQESARMIKMHTQPLPLHLNASKFCWQRYTRIEYTPKWIWLKRQPLIRNSNLCKGH